MVADTFSLHSPNEIGVNLCRITDEGRKRFQEPLIESKIGLEYGCFGF
jgi:hypothetical protein